MSKHACHSADMSKKSRASDTSSQTSTARIDKWLWAARFFKTRSLASTAVKGGKVEVDGHKAKPSTTVCAGQRLYVTKDQRTFEVDIDAVSEKRGPASQAQQLYTETAASQDKRERQAEEQRIANMSMPRPTRRPDKRQRRRLRQFKFGDD